MRTWCADNFAELGINFVPRQGSHSLTHMSGTVRGMHFQRQPFEEAKLIRVSRGGIHDVFVDLRVSSPDRGRPFSIELDAESGGLLYLPAGFAHGYQTQTDDVLVEYLMDERYEAGSADGFRWDDPACRIDWPQPISQISAKDRSWPDLAGRVPWARMLAL